MKTILSKFLFFAALLLILTPTASAATIYWKGTTADWNTASNWSSGTVPATGDIVNIGNGNTFTTQPVISANPTGSPATINIGTTQSVQLTINSGVTLKVTTLNMTPGTSYTGAVDVNGTLTVTNISMSSTSSIVLGSSSTLNLAGSVSGGTITPSTSTSAKILLNGTTTQSFGTGSTSLNGNIGVLEISNTYYSSSTSRGVTFTGGTVNHLIVDSYAIFNANASLVEGTAYYATIADHATYLSRSTFNFHANDVVDATATLEFTAPNQTINLYKAKADLSNTCPNVVFTGTTITVNGGPAPYSTSNTTTNESVYLVRGNLDITSTTSTVTYNGVTLIDLNGNFTGTNSLSPGSIPVNIAGSWTNTDTDNLSGIITYDGTTSSSTQIVATNVNYLNDLVFTGASPKRVASGTLQVSGTLDNSAGSSVDFTTNNTTTLMNGTIAQTIKGGTAANNTYTSNPVYGTIFYNLTIATNGTTTATKTTTLTGNTNIAPTGILKLTTSGGVLDATSPNSLTLMSGATGSGAVDDLSNANTLTGTALPVINGNVNVQRFLTGGTGKTGTTYIYRGYRLLSSPVNITSVTPGLSNYISLNYLKGYTSGGLTFTGAFTAGSGSGFSATNATPTIYFYSERRAPSNTTFISGKNIGVISIGASTVVLSNNTSNNVSIPVGNGFIFYFVGPSTRTSGSASIAPANALMTAQGYLNQGSISVNLWNTPANGSAGQLSYNYPTLPATGAGFNMVGNPYACTINLQTVLTDNTGIDAIYLLQNTNPGQKYVAYTANGTSAPSSGYAVSGEGFLVHAIGAAKTLTFKETQKAASTQLTGPALLMSTVKPTQQKLTGLFMKMEQDSLNYDYCGIYFRDDWSAKYEDGDAVDMDGAAPTIYMSSYTSDGQRMAVNHMPDYQTGSRIRLYASAKTDGLYKLKLEGVRNIDTLYDIYLIDKYKKDSLDMRQYGVYNFNVIQSDTASFGGYRFELVIRRKALPSYQLRSFTAEKVAEGIKLTWTTNNEGNYTSFGLEKADNSNGTQQFNLLYSKQSDGSSVYTYIDANPLLNGINTYRLKQNDIDSRITYSGLVHVNYNAGRSLLSLYPNPARETIQITVPEDPAKVTYNTTIYSSTGVIVARKSTAGSSWSAEVSGLSPGSYTAEVKDSKGKVIGQAKFIKVQ